MPRVPWCQPRSPSHPPCAHRQGGTQLRLRMGPWRDLGAGQGAGHARLLAKPRAKAHGVGKRAILHPPDLFKPSPGGFGVPSRGAVAPPDRPGQLRGAGAAREWAQPSAGSERRKCLRRRRRGDSNVILDSLRWGLARKIQLRWWQRAWRGTSSAHRTSGEPLLSADPVGSGR